MKNLWFTIFVLLGGMALAQTLVAEGFNSPQGVLVDDNNNIWVIDSGMGGDEGQVTAFFPAAGAEVTARYGNTARIVKVTPAGDHSEIAVLPSMVVGQEITGGARLALLNDTLYATSGFWFIGAGPEAPQHMGSVVKIADGDVTEVANLWTFEREQNPDGHIIDTHPYGLLAGPDGHLWVADAGGNALLNVDPMTGTTEVVAVFEGIPGPLPNPARADAMESDPVPTAVALGLDGHIYVSLLSGFPFIPGTAKVLQVSYDGEVSDYAVGLTSLTDLRLGPDGHLYAVQFAVFGEQGPAPMTGALVRVGEGESSEVVVDGLMFPTSVDFDAFGDAYIVVNGVGAPGSGQVHKYVGVAAP